MKVYATCVAGPPLDASKSAIEAMSLSSVVYALFSPVLWLAHQYALAEHHPAVYAAMWFMVLLVAPVVLARTWAHLRTTKWFLNHFPHPIGKAWDYVFARRDPCYVIIVFRSGKRVGGTYGGRSFASSGYSEEQIFIEEVWNIDQNEGFIEKHTNSRGMLVSNSQIESIEFIGPYDKEHENPCTNTAEHHYQ